MAKMILKNVLIRSKLLCPDKKDVLLHIFSSRSQIKISKHVNLNYPQIVDISTQLRYVWNDNNVITLYNPQIVDISTQCQYEVTVDNADQQKVLIVMFYAKW